jgi:hypothetical protein
MHVTNDMFVGYGYGGDRGYLEMAPGARLHVHGELSMGQTTVAGHALTPSTNPIVVDGSLIAGPYRCTSKTRQNGGTIRSADFRIGIGNLGVAEYQLTNGAAIEVTRPDAGSVDCYVLGPTVWSSSAVLLMGDAESTGAIGVGSGAGTGKVNLVVRDYAQVTGNSAAAVRGWGDVALDGDLVNHGQVIADGYGTDRDLLMTNFARVTQGTDDSGAFWSWGWFQSDGTKAGWYARDGGRLLLPPLSGIGPNTTVRWGDDSDDIAVVNTNDLVNSLMLQFTNVTGGEVAVSLLATNRADALVQTNTVLGVWSIDGSGFAFGAGSCVLTVCYDAPMAAAGGLNEADLKIWWYRKGWREVTASVDTAAKTITSTPLGTFGLFSVSTEEPAPAPPPEGTLIMVN